MFSKYNRSNHMLLLFFAGVSIRETFLIMFRILKQYTQILKALLRKFRAFSKVNDVNAS